MFKSRVVGTATLNSSLYVLNLNECVDFQTESDESNPMSCQLFWYIRLGLIPQNNEKAYKRWYFSSLLDNPRNCIESAKGKLTKTNIKGSICSQNLVEIIHTDTC